LCCEQSARVTAATGLDGLADQGLVGWTQPDVACMTRFRHSGPMAWVGCRKEQQKEQQTLLLAPFLTGPAHRNANFSFYPQCRTILQRRSRPHVL